MWEAVSRTPLFVKSCASENLGFKRADGVTSDLFLSINLLKFENLILCQ